MRRLHPVWLVVVALLAGCSAPARPLSQGSPVAVAAAWMPPSGCRLRRAATYTLLGFEAGKPVIEIVINGRRARMQVDSGAETSVLTRVGAAALGLAPGPMRRREVSGLGGRGGYGTVQLASIGFAGETVRGLEVPVLALSGGDTLSGLVGGDLLSAYQVEFDFAGRRITLYRSYGCRDVQPPWPSAAGRLAWTGDRALPVVPVRLDGRWMRALIDTGASHSAVGETQAGLPAGALQADRPTLSYGAGNLAMAGRLHEFGRLEIGKLTVDRIPLRVVTLDPALGIDLLIGMDVLAGRRLWLDYGGRHAFAGDAGTGR